MKKSRRIMLIVLAVMLLASANIFAATLQPDGTMSVGAPTLSAIGNTANCGCRITFSGKYIDATMELWQGSTLIASWNQTGTGRVVFSETASIINGLSYTLTVSGTADGVAFTPRSVTKTL